MTIIPVFNWIADEQRTKGMNLDCLFFMTDGYGDFPAKPPPFPVDWIVTENYMKDIPFGEIIEL
jgi:predicted metal-dependent peptidase